MLFKRFIEGKPMLNAEGLKKTQGKCFRRESECDGCGEHSTILGEMMKMVMLGVVLWAGVTFGGSIAPYPFNLIMNTDIIHPPPMYDFPFPSAEVLEKLPTVTGAHINRSVQFSKMNVERLETLENNLQWAGITPTSGSVAKGFFLNGYPSEEAMHFDKSSLIVTGASQNLVYSKCSRYGVAVEECASFISTLNLRDSEFGEECASLERFTCRTDMMTSRYRTFDGSCNNPVRSSWGQALTGYKRLLHPRYSDGIEKPRQAASHRPLPSARIVSTRLASNLDSPDKSKTIGLAVWSQFLYHDLVDTPVRKTIFTKEAVRCCDNDGRTLLPRYHHPSCMPITVPSGDVLNQWGYDSCMEYTRSVTTYRGDCTFGASEQMNQATHFLDGSHIYGTNSRHAAALREKTGGLMKTSTIDGEEHLPLVANPVDKCLVSTNSDACFNTGDTRANIHPWLTSLHWLAVKEHNRIARELGTLNPGWSSDKLYHEARRIVVAQLQHITYKHWLPALTGKSVDELYDSYDAGYNPDVDPTVTNSFATAGFHFVNSILDQDIELIDSKDNVTTYRIGDYYYKPELLVREEALPKILRGMVSQNGQGLDLNYDEDLQNRWLGGMDVIAADIQRGRDHGLPGYTQYRTLCGLPLATTFQHLADRIPEESVEKLSRVYEHPGDVDLVVGAMAERPLSGSLLGPTLTCLIKEQLWRTRAGDRYFYTHTDEAGSFTKRQVAEIKRVSLARLLCENAGITRVQRDVFKLPSDSNPVVSCEQIKKVNLEAWQTLAPVPRLDILTRTNKWIKDKVSSGNTTK